VSAATGTKRIDDPPRLFDPAPAAARANNLEAVCSRGDGWRVPVNPMPPDALADLLHRSAVGERAATWS